MTSSPKRLSAKFFTVDNQAVDLTELVAIYQRWIQQHTVEGLLIDAADYKHVPEGPGVLLIGHEGDYAIDLKDDRYGMRYIRKWETADTLTESLALVFRLAAIASQKMSNEASLGGVEFDFHQVEFQLIDRLKFPNTPETFAAIQDEVSTFLQTVYGVDDIQLTYVEGHPREPLTILATSASVPDDLITQLENAALPAS